VYCSLSCRSIRGKAVVGVDRRQRAAIAERRLTAHQRAVAAFCAGCEPSGRCLTPECELRPVSPLPLFTERVEVEAVRARPHCGYREPGQQGAITTGVWARYTPEDRAARVARAAEASRRARGLAS
jgi:hypothetical protein